MGGRQGAGPAMLARLGVVADVQYADKPDGAHTRVVPHEIRRYRAALRKLRDAVDSFTAENTHGTPIVGAVLHLGDLIDGNETLAQTRRDFDAVMGQFDRMAAAGVAQLHVLGESPAPGATSQHSAA